MGSLDSAIYVYFGGDGPLTIIDFEEGMSDLQETQITTGGAAETLTGHIERLTTGAFARLRVSLQRFDNPALLRDLRSLTAHLQAGHSIGLTLSRSKAWAGWCSLLRIPVAGDTQVITDVGNEFSAWAPSAAIEVGDELCVQASSPTPWREWVAVESLLTGGLGLKGWNVSEAVRYTYTDGGPVLVRHADFYPCLRLVGPTDRDLITQDYRRSWTWTADLQEDHEALAILADGGAEALAGTSASAGSTLQQSGAMGNLLGSWRHRGGRR